MYLCMYVSLDTVRACPCLPPAPQILNPTLVVADHSMARIKPTKASGTNGCLVVAWENLCSANEVYDARAVATLFSLPLHTFQPFK